MTRDTSSCPKCGKCRDRGVRISEAIIELERLQELLVLLGQYGVWRRLVDIINDLAGCHCPAAKEAAQ